MRIHERRAATLFAVVGVLCASAGVALWAHENGSAQQAREAIERLHRQDVEATLSGKADDFAKLWDNEAVRLQPGNPAEIGQTVIYADDKREEANSNAGRTLCYQPEIRDLQIAGDWAFEWGYFSYKESANAKPGRGKVLRVLKRQPDGSWRFTHVMSFTEQRQSAAPITHPCE